MSACITVIWDAIVEAIESGDFATDCNVSCTFALKKLLMTLSGKIYLSSISIDSSSRSSLFLSIVS